MWSDQGSKGKSLDSGVQKLIFLRRRFSTRVALADTAAACSCHLRFEYTVTVRYVKDSTGNKVLFVIQWTKRSYAIGGSGPLIYKQLIA